MEGRRTAIGIVVLALVATGVLWVRSRTAGTGTVPAEQTAPASADRDAPAPAAGDEALPDVTLTEGTAEVGGVRITLSVTPNPPVAFAKTRVRVRAEVGGSPVVLEGGRVSFEMSMPMGDHRYSLVPGADGWQEAAVVLPT
jgi:hypothetical protein